MSQELVRAATSFALAGRVDSLVALVRPEAGRAWAFLVGALIYLGVRVAQLDGNIANQLCEEKVG